MPAGCLACGFSRGAATVAALALRRGDALRGSAAGGNRGGHRGQTGACPDVEGLAAYGRSMPTKEVMSRPFRSSAAAAAAAGASALRDHQQEKEAPMKTQQPPLASLRSSRRGLGPLGSPPLVFWPS